MQLSLRCLAHSFPSWRPGYPFLPFSSWVALSSRGPLFSMVKLSTGVELAEPHAPFLLPDSYCPYHLEKPLFSPCLLATSSPQPWSWHQHLLPWVSLTISDWIGEPFNIPFLLIPLEETAGTRQDLSFRATPLSYTPFQLPILSVLFCIMWSYHISLTPKQSFGHPMFLPSPRDPSVLLLVLTKQLCKHSLTSLKLPSSGLMGSLSIIVSICLFSFSPYLVCPRQSIVSMMLPLVPSNILFYLLLSGPLGQYFFFTLN